MGPEALDVGKNPESEISQTMGGFYKSDKFLGLRENSQAAYRNDLAQFSAFLGARNITSLRQIATFEIDDFLAGFKTATAVRKMSVINVFLGWAKSQGIIDQTPQVELPKFKKENDPLEYLTPEECQLLILQAKKRKNSKRDTALGIIALKTGADASEIVALNSDDMPGIINGQLMIKFGGVGRTRRRVVSIDEEASQVLKSLLATRPEREHLFANSHGDRLTRQGFWTILKDLGKIIGKPNLSPKILRNTYIMNHASNDITALAKQLGIGLREAKGILKRKEASFYSTKIKLPKVRSRNF